MILDEETYLEHYGVKGMKWGVRRKTRGQAGRVEKLQRHAERRPTRGNVRKAQRAEQNLNRRGRRAAKKAAKEKEYQDFANKVVKSIGKRSPSELYAVRGSQGNIIMTGEEFTKRVNMGMRFSSIDSVGMKVDDGR